MLTQSLYKRFNLKNTYHLCKKKFIKYAYFSKGTSHSWSDLRQAPANRVILLGSTAMHAIPVYPFEHKALFLPENVSLWLFKYSRGVTCLGSLLGLWTLSSLFFNLSDIMLIHLAHGLMVEIIHLNHTCLLETLWSALGAIQFRLKQLFCNHETVLGLVGIVRLLSIEAKAARPTGRFAAN